MLSQRFFFFFFECVHSSLDRKSSSIGSVFDSGSNNIEGFEENLENVANINEYISLLY